MSGDRRATAVGRIRRFLSSGGLALTERLEDLAGRRSARRASTRVRLTVVFLQWDASVARDALAALDRRLASLDGIDVRRVVVDNSGGRRPCEGGGDVISGDNTAREFSGWERGIEHVRAAGEATDVWLLVNDRFPTARYPFLDHLSTGAVRVTQALRGVVGRIDYYPGRVESFGLDVSSWVNTTFYLVADAVLREVGGPVMLGPDRLDEVLPAEFRPEPSPFEPTGPVSPLHGRYLVGFLGHAPDAPHGAHWYRRLEPTELTWGEFRGKVMSILNEQLFSARARAAGFPLVEMALASRLGSIGVDTPPVRSVLARIAAGPGPESLRANRVAHRAWVAARALASR